jgi:AsmA protein
MNRFIKWILIGGLGLTGLIIVALLIIPFFVNVNQYKPLMEKKVSEATGRPFVIGGDLELSLFPWAGVSFSDLELGNPKGFDEETFLRIGSFEARVKLLPLISRHIEVQKFIVSGLQATLIKTAAGKVNWQFSAPGKAPAVPSPETSQSVSDESKGDVAVDEKMTVLPINKLDVGDFSISKSSVLYLDQAANTRHEVADIGLTLKDVSFDKPIQFDLSAHIDRQPVALTGIVGPVSKDPGRAAIPVEFQLSAIEALHAKIAGTIMNAVENPQAELTLDVKPFSLRKVLGSFESAPEVQTADPEALKRIGLNAHIKAGQTAVAVTQGKLTLDDTHLAFSINASQFERPNVKFDLELDKIDVNRYLPPPAATKEATKPPSTEQEQPASAKSESKAPDYGPMRRLILDGRLAAETIVVQKATLQDTRVTIKAKDGVFRIDPFSLKAYQGIISGKAKFNVQGKTPSSDMDIRIANLQIAPLVKAQTDKDLIEGVTNASVNLRMNGDDPERIKQTLNGEGEIRISDGAIVGIDLAAMARNVKAAFGGAQPSGERPRTDFTELLIPYRIRDGVFHTTQTSVKSPFLRVLASGKADLNKETIDFRIEPKAVGTIKGQGDESARSGLMVPVLVSGTFTEPKYRPDLKAIAEQQIVERVLEKEGVRKALEKEELKPYKEPVKELLKGFMKK